MECHPHAPSQSCRSTTSRSPAALTICRRTSQLPARAANMSGVVPEDALKSPRSRCSDVGLSAASRHSSTARSICTHLSWPRSAAQCSGVSGDWRRRCLTADRAPALAVPVSFCADGNSSNRPTASSCPVTHTYDTISHVNTPKQKSPTKTRDLTLNVLLLICRNI